MTELIIAVAGLLAVATTAAVAPRLRIAAPLLLVVLGIVLSFLPFVPVVDVDPEWILAGILPPLLYSASVSMPSMNFRRELGAISGLSVVLVVVSAVVLGGFFSLVIPDLSFWWGVALGAIVSPTDAVATSIVKRIGVSGRVVSVLDGESLLNDATALVLLRTAIAGTAASVSLWGVAGSFAYSVVVALVLGAVVGVGNLRLRSRVKDPTVNTVLSFTVPFLASIPAELLGASGLVAAVVAGLVTGHGAPRHLPPQHRLSETQNWHTVELVLEGAIFLIMGLELAGIVEDVHDEHSGVGIAVLVAAGALVLTLLVRAGYIVPLLLGLRRRARRKVGSKPRIDEMQQRLDGDPADLPRRTPNSPDPSPERIARIQTRLRRMLSDIDYLAAAPLGWREGSVLVWAGMRGAVTLAAAQTLPSDTPHRSLLVLVAFLVAAASLLVQGSTLGAFVRWVRPAPPDDAALLEEREEIDLLLARVREDVTTAAHGDDRPTALPDRPVDAEIAVIEAQRAAVLDARDDGTYSAPSLASALTYLDATQMSLQIKSELTDQE